MVSSTLLKQVYPCYTHKVQLHVTIQKNPTQIGCPTSEVPCDSAAAAAIPLTDTTLIQCFGWEKHSIAPDWLGNKKISPLQTLLTLKEVMNMHYYSLKSCVSLHSRGKCNLIHFLSLKQPCVHLERAKLLHYTPLWKFLCPGIDVTRGATKMHFYNITRGENSRFRDQKSSPVFCVSHLDLLISPIPKAGGRAPRVKSAVSVHGWSKNMAAL